jgi:hypothetical protein
MLKIFNGTEWVATDTPVSDVTIASQTPPADTTVNWEDDSPVLTLDQQAVVDANSNLQTLVAQMAPSLAQAQIDLATLAASTDALAPILARTVQGIVTLAQGLADALVVLQIIAASEIK